MLKSLIVLANKLDNLGLFSEADVLDEIITQAAGMDPDEYEKYYGRPMDSDRLNQFEQDFMEEHAEPEEDKYDMDNPDFNLNEWEKDVVNSYFGIAHYNSLNDIPKDDFEGLIEYVWVKQSQVDYKKYPELLKKYSDLHIKVAQFYDKKFNQTANAEDNNKISFLTTDREKVEMYPVTKRMIYDLYELDSNELFLFIGFAKDGLSGYSMPIGWKKNDLEYFYKRLLKIKEHRDMKRLKKKNPANEDIENEANAEDTNEYNIPNIAKEVKQVVLKAKKELGEDLAGHSMLDLVADNLSYPLDVLKKALIIAGVGYKPAQHKKEIAQDTSTVWPYYFNSPVAMVGGKMVPHEEVRLGEEVDEVLKGQKVWVKFDDKQGYQIDSMKPIGPFDTKQEAEKAVEEYAAKNNLTLYYGD